MSGTPCAPTQRLGYQERIEAGGLIFRSDFEAGNCWAVHHRRAVPSQVLPTEQHYDGWKPHDGSHALDIPVSAEDVSADGEEQDLLEVWLSSDCMGSEHEARCRGWFYFAVAGGQAGRKVTMRLMNAYPHEKLYSAGMQPVWRYTTESDRDWRRIDGSVQYRSVGANGVLTFPFEFTSDAEVMICFTYPYTLSMADAFLAEVEAHCGREGVFYACRDIASTLDGHTVQEVTITHTDNTDAARRLADDAADGADDAAAPHVVLLSARVHPGEAPASHILEGLIRSAVGLPVEEEGGDLASEGELPMETLLKRVILKIVPVVNPDGVLRGHSRNDSKGRNLNRYYGSPLEDMPSAAAVRKLFVALHATGRLFCYIDMHAHHGKRGMFFYGNAHDTPESQAESQAIPFLLSRRNRHFDYEGSNFSQRNMLSPGGRDGTKEGSARVALYQASGLVRCYTMEVNYNTSNIVATKGVVPPKYQPVHFHGMGRDMLHSVLDAVVESASYLSARSELTTALLAKKEKAKATLERKNSLKSKINPAFLKAQQQTAHQAETASSSHKGGDVLVL
eukprot:Rhum_TRINITY_DN92_c0_g1::Rhum_TRINITY_DN92_c0_g1_i1::g.195::m.195